MRKTVASVKLVAHGVLQVTCTRRVERVIQGAHAKRFERVKQLAHLVQGAHAKPFERIKQVASLVQGACTKRVSSIKPDVRVKYVARLQMSGFQIVGFQMVRFQMVRFHIPTV